MPWAEKITGGAPERAKMSAWGIPNIKITFL